MKVYLTILTLALMVVAVGSAYGAVADTKHNLSSSGPGEIKAEGTSEVCVFCHTPHNANTDIDIGLWNRKTQDPGVTYTMYDGTTGVPDEHSMVCLTCHDGTMALNNMANMPNTLSDTYTAITMTGTGVGADGKLNSDSYAFLGTDLSDDHPIGEWPTGYVWNLQPIADIVAAQTAAGHYYATPVDNGDGTYNIECISCHGAHNNQNGSFLLTNNANSALCNQCHRV